MQPFCVHLKMIFLESVKYRSVRKLLYLLGTYKRTNLSEPRQPEKDLHWCPSAADRSSNIGVIKHQSGVLAPSSDV